MIIHSQIADIETASGIMRCYVHRPVAAGSWPVVLLYSEIFQQTGPIERSARMVAGHGYIVLVPEVFHELNAIGTVLGYDDAGRIKGNADKAAKPAENYDSDNRALIAFAQTLEHWNGKIGAMGFCIGGHLAFRAALQPEIRATACFYATDLHTDTIPNQPGQHSLERCGEISGELLMVWGKQDNHIPAAGRTQVYQALTAAGLTFGWHEFNAQHAFMRDEGERYDAALALLGYRMTLDLFARTIA